MFGFNFKRAPRATTPAVVSADTPTRRRSMFMKNAVSALFSGARTDRTTDSWGTQPLPADQIISQHQRILVARSREQCANNDYAKSFLRLCRQNIVGPQGVQLTAKTMTRRGQLDLAANEAIEWAFYEWSKAENCDVKGRQSLRAIETACVMSAAKDGEFMVRMVWGEDAGPWGFALQTLDPQRCPVDMDVARPPGGGFIRHGVHFNSYGRATAYYFSTTDEALADYTYSGQGYIKVPAEQVIHGFTEDMVGQKRGLPWLATSLYRMRHMNAFEEASIINARKAATKRPFIQWDVGSGPELDDDEIPELDMDPSVLFETLPSGAKMVEYSPQYPSGEFAPFMKSMLRGMAAGMGVPYNELAADLEGVNFSSIRQGTLDSRESWKELQQWLMETLLDRVFGEWLKVALLSGRVVSKGKPLPAAELQRYQAHEWQGRRWQWIDPRADMTAAESSKNNMLASPSAIIREQGKDPLAVWQETARDIRTMTEMLVAEGLPKKDAREFVLLSMGRQPDKPVPPEAAKKAQNEQE